MLELSYEPTLSSRPVVVEQIEEITRIKLLTKTPVLPFFYATLAIIMVAVWGCLLFLPHKVFALSIIPIIPICCYGARLIHFIFHFPKPVRAVFDIDKYHVRMTLRDPITGQLHSTLWARKAVVEIRANRFEPGLWVNVPGHMMETCLMDVSRESIRHLEGALNAVLWPDAAKSPGASPA